MATISRTPVQPTPYRGAAPGYVLKHNIGPYKAGMVVGPYDVYNGKKIVDLDAEIEVDIPPMPPPVEPPKIIEPPLRAASPRDPVFSFKRSTATIPSATPSLKNWLPKQAKKATYKAGKRKGSFNI